MTYQHYSPELKAKIVLEVLQGEKELGEIAKEHNINPNLIRKWRSTFLEKASLKLQTDTESPRRAKQTSRTKATK